MTVYIVLADTYLDGCGSDFHIFLVTMDEDTAIRKYLEMSKIYGIYDDYGEPRVVLKQTTLEVDCDIDIGGYCE